MASETMTDDAAGMACECTTPEQIANCDWVCSGDLSSCTLCGNPVSAKPHLGFRCDECLNEQQPEPTDGE